MMDDIANNREHALREQIKELQRQLHDELAKTALNNGATLEAGEKKGSRLLVVANRLPMSLHRDEVTGERMFRMSSGGLVSALLGVKDMEMLWIGWPGAEIAGQQEQADIRAKLRVQRCEPVFLPAHVAELYYSGFANNVLWPLFHYISLPIAELLDAHNMFTAYEQANHLFAEVVLSVYKPGDVVWVHDYHLMLLPAMLRSAAPSIKVGFFLHTPFPSSEIYRTLPQREEILRGVLSADLVGFHSYDYARHFHSGCTRILGLDVTPQGVDIGGGFCTVGTFPIGIEIERFKTALQTDAVKKHCKDLMEQFKGRRIIVGIDRLDYIKGIPHKIHAFEHFLADNPNWVGKVALVQIAVPSRTDVKEYQRLASETHELVGRVNGRFGSLTDVPIHYLDQSIAFDKMCALLNVADVCLISSLRDGMNLVSYEFIVCQAENPGVLILSEFCGAAQSLGAGSIRINPWDVNETASAIQYALDMSPEERAEYHRYAMQYVCSHTAQFWAETFVNQLRRTATSIHTPIVPRRLDIEDVVARFKRSAHHRVIVTGLVGTLTQTRATGMSYDRFQKFAKSGISTLQHIKNLANDPKTTVVVLTSRNRAMCASVLGDTPAWIAAENGVFLRKSATEDWEILAESLDLSWMEEVRQVMNYFVERTPRTFIEREDSYLSWHYRDADSEFGQQQARDLLMHLVSGPLVNSQAEVVSSSKIVQVRPAGVTKGAMMERIISRIQAEHGEIDFVMCVGNFLNRDEDVYEKLSIGPFSRKRRKGSDIIDGVITSPLVPSVSFDEHCSVVTVSVGAKAGRAKTFVRNVPEVEYLLRQLSLVVEGNDRSESQSSVPDADANFDFVAPGVIDHGEDETGQDNRSVHVAS